ncbi:PIG-L family deacetylase [Puia sp.]|uniref:PIG-L family deacetylase n=1 Tax=Puia sp. TaxID=2045100 RepID=UPI002F40C8AF
MNRVFAFLLAAAVCGMTASAQGPETVTSAEIYLRLNKLNVLGTVLYMAAHPDDENSRLIAYMVKDRLYRTAYLSMTRGDGGQNLIGDEQGVDLGLIRTQEMMAARRADGAEQFFSRAFDFGFTKSTDEALATWGKEKVLSDAVWVIRKFQPDVIITRFPPDSRAGHGHHSASAVIAQEAFTAAADPSRFPEQFKYGVKPWKVKRILWNTFNFGSTNTTSEDQLKIDVGGFNAIVGKSYGELAAISRTNHKSQGAALTPARGQSMEYFTLVAGDPAHGDPMDGVETSWRRVEGGEKIEGMVKQLIRDFSLLHPEKSVPGLVEVYKAVDQLTDGYWKTQKLKEIKQLIADCSGLWLEAATRTAYAVQGDSLGITVTIDNRLNAPLAVSDVSLNDATGGFTVPMKQVLEGDKNYSFSRNIYVSPDKPVTQPYWLAQEMSPGSFNVSDQRLIGDPQGAAAYSVSFRLTAGGQELVYTRPVQYKHTDPVKGELYEPVTVLPPVTAQFDPELVLFTDGEEKGIRVEATDRTSRLGLPKFTLTPTPGVTVGPPSGLSWLAKATAGKTETITAGLTFEHAGRRDTALQLKTIAYDHIPRIDYFRPAREKFVLADVKIAGHRIGYIEGAGDKVPEALVQMGYEVVMLKEKDCTPAFLKSLDAVIAGVRAYDVHGWLGARHEALMDYVKEGGNLIVQYNRDNLGRMSTAIGPYPFAVSNLRVTDEKARVNFLIPDHAVLNYPNKIGPADFEGWIQERGIYFAGQTDPAYQQVLSMNDPGEQEQKGSLVIAKYGKGTFVYTGLVFFRELPAGVPGAYRLLANIIALNQKRGF